MDEIRLSLSEFLAKKPLYYAKIDYTRMPRAYASISQHLKIPKIIHLVGTNGKGTTGRFLANALVALNQKVGHYSSPHIQNFNERIWLNGENVEDELLEKAHKRLQELLSEEFKGGLSYFEYTTFLAILIYEECDYIVLEAGLGGEFDATNVFAKLISVITPIGMDHEDFLGKSIKEIALTKLKSVTQKAVVGRQKYKEVKEVSLELVAEFIDYETLLSSEDYSCAQEVSVEMQLPHYLKENLLLSISVLKILGFTVKKNLFKSQCLEGRMQKIRDNIYLDVGHNTLAAEAISKHFKAKSVNLVYNSYKDKDYLSILALLKPIIKVVEIISIDEERIVNKDELIGALKSEGLSYKDFTQIKDDETYLVFGSFSVVQAFKKQLDCL